MQIKLPGIAPVICWFKLDAIVTCSVRFIINIYYVHIYSVTEAESEVLAVVWGVEEGVAKLREST